MAEFVKFVERRGRVEAFCFHSHDLAMDVARALGAQDWTLFVKDDGWEWGMDAILSYNPYVTQRVNRGDFVTRDGEVIPPLDFRTAWEEDK